MRKKRKHQKLFLGIFLVVLSLVLLNIFMQEATAKFVIGFAVIAAIVITMAKGLEINGMSDIFAVALPTVMPVLIRFFSDIPFIYKVSEVYRRIAQIFCGAIGKDIAVNISEEMSVTITITLIFLIFEIWNCNKDGTAMKILRRSSDEELKDKNFAEKSEMFCQTLRQWLEEINRETNWNEAQFTPLEAEVEMDCGGKRKKKYEDLIKCLKKNHRHGTVFLVLGSPGSGKSVSMRKLCLDLLKESKRTKKIPVYINLKEWNEEWDPDHMPEKKDLIVFIRKTFEAKADFSTESFLNEYFQRMLDDGRWYFVFDSFDEMPCLMGKKNCQELIDGVSSLLYQFMTGPNQNGGVVASRLYKAPSSAVRASVTLKIQEFSDIKIKTMLKKYLIHYEKAIKLLFDGREDLVSLCRNPFYLALLINYISDKGFVLPKNQMELYQSFINGRLKKCGSRLEREGLDESDIYQAATELALFMQETEGCGLECPTRLLYQRGNESYWQKAFALLKYAKICRVGGQNETISFVHRRFQEFFLVENIIDQKQAIGYENYRDILSDAGMRDALVLYCEVAEEEKAKEIANFCWKTIQTNMKFAYNIHNKESQELVCALYFMKEAFRNRKEVLKDFIDDFYQLTKKILYKRKKGKNKNADKYYIYVDYVIMLALVNAMILFSRAQLKELVLKVFKMDNRWLNDVIMQNCREFDTLGYSVEKEFVKYFGKMDIRVFLKRFFDVQFSLSVSEKFRYIRKMHILTMLVDIACVLMVISSGALLLLNFFKFFIYSGIIQINMPPGIFLHIDYNFKLGIVNMILENKWMLIVIMVISCYILTMDYFSFQGKIIFVFGYTLTIFSFLDGWLFAVVGVEVVGSVMVVIIAGFLSCIHDLGMFIDKKKYEKINFKKLIKGSGMVILLLTIGAAGIVGIIGLSYYLFQKFPFIMSGIFIIPILIFLFWLLIKGVCGALHYVKDCMWLRNHSAEMKHMERSQLENNLEHIHFNRIRHKYLELLLMDNTELTGKWSKDIRPWYLDDRVDYTLAKLDCLKLDSCDYLF